MTYMMKLSAKPIGNVQLTQDQAITMSTMNEQWYNSFGDLLWQQQSGVLCLNTKVLDEEQALKNSGQSLARLNQRGGLGLDEALALAEKRPYHAMSDSECLHKLSLIAQAMIDKGVGLSSPSPTEGLKPRPPGP